MKRAQLAFAAIVGVSSLVSASLPIVAGPGIDASSVGLDFPYQNYRPGRPINNAGTTIGTAWAMNGVDQDRGYRGVRYDRNSVGGALSVLNTDTDGFSVAFTYSINASNWVVGTSGRFAGDDLAGRRAARWDPAGNLVELECFGVDPDGYGFAEAYDINNAGIATGFSEQYDASHNHVAYVAARWSAGGTAGTILGGLSQMPSFQSSDSGIAINSAGVVVGYAQRVTASGDDLGYRPTRWEANSTVATEMQNLGVSAAGRSDARVWIINDAGVSAGEIEKFVGSVYHGYRSARWSATGQIQELWPLGNSSEPTGDYTVTNAINASGAVAGSAVRHDAGNVYRGMRPVVWPAGRATPTELQSLGEDVNGIASGDANGINASGYVIGDVTAYDGAGAEVGSRAVFWRPDGSVVDLNTLLPAGSSWTLTTGNGISDTGFVTGYGLFSVNAETAYDRLYTMLIPEAGTYGRGDANFDTQINFDDLLILAQHYGEANASLDYNVGDLNLDGNVNFDDLLALAQHYGTSAAIALERFDELFAGEWALAQSMVPEPAVLSVCGALATVARRRR